jgi:hypothetical protein
LFLLAAILVKVVEHRLQAAILRWGHRLQVQVQVLLQAWIQLQWLVWLAECLQDSLVWLHLAKLAHLALAVRSK